MFRTGLIAVSLIAIGLTSASEHLVAQQQTITFQIPVVLERVSDGENFTVSCVLYESTDATGLSMRTEEGYLPPGTHYFSETLLPDPDGIVRGTATVLQTPLSGTAGSYKCVLSNVLDGERKYSDYLKEWGGPGTVVVAKGGLRFSQGIYLPAPLGWTPQNNSTNPAEGNQTNLQTQTTIINNSGGNQ